MINDTPSASGRGHYGEGFPPQPPPLQEEVEGGGGGGWGQPRAARYRRHPTGGLCAFNPADGRSRKKIYKEEGTAEE